MKNDSKQGSPPRGKQADIKSPGMKDPETLSKNLKSRAKLKKMKDVEEGSDEDQAAETGAYPDEPQSPGKKTNATAEKMAKMKKKRKNEAAIGGSLSQDFQSFDILWFDLTTKTRALVTELCQPVIDKVHEHKDLLNRIIKQADENHYKVDALEGIVYNRDKKLDVFEQIHDRITQVEADRKTIEQRLENNDSIIMRSFEDFRFKMENHDKIQKTMVQNTEQALDDLSELKDTIRTQNDALASNIKEVSENMVNDSTELRNKMSELWGFMASLKQRSQEHQGTLDRLLGRMDAIEAKAAMLDKCRVDLELNKCDNLIFQENQKRTDEDLREQFQMVSETRDNCKRLAHYQEKYQPVRIQAMIGDTLYACLNGPARRAHELYDSDKLSLLYKSILSDKGEGEGIQKMIVELNEMAKYKIGEAEKANARQAQEDAQADTLREEEEQDEQKAKEEQEKQAQDSPLKLKATQQYSNHTSGVGFNKTGGLTSPNSVSVVMPEEGHYRLIDVLNSGFHMASNDKDYRLSHDQLIKVCKVLLHKVNCVDIKNVAERKQQDVTAIELFTKHDANTRSQLEEVTQLVHSVHHDFESFLTNHKKASAELNMKVNKLAEVGHKTLDNMDEIKDSIQKQATMLVCQTEFSSIEQTLQYHYEAERAKFAALAKAANANNDSKIKRYGSESKRTNGSVGSLGPSVIAKAAGGFVPNYQSVDEQFIQQQRSLDVLGSKKGSKDTTLSAGDHDQMGKINYRQHLIPKIQLMEMRKTLLEKCEEVIDNTAWPFVRNNLNTTKIFNDLLQFHGENYSTGLTLHQNSMDINTNSISGSKGVILTGPMPANNKTALKSHTPAGKKVTTPSQLTGLTAHSSRNPHKGKKSMHTTQIGNFHGQKNSVVFNSSVISQGQYPEYQTIASGVSNLGGTGVFAGGHILQGTNSNFMQGIGGGNFASGRGSMQVQQTPIPHVTISQESPEQIEEGVIFPKI